MKTAAQILGVLLLTGISVNPETAPPASAMTPGPKAAAALPASVITPAAAPASPAPVLDESPMSPARVRAATRTLTTQGVDAETAALLGARLAETLPPETDMETLRQRVLEEFRAAGGVLPGETPLLYVEQPEAYEAQGYSPEQATEHARNAQAANAAAVEAAHQSNRTLAEQLSRPRVRMSTPQKSPAELLTVADSAVPEVREAVRSQLARSTLPMPVHRSPSLEAAWKTFKDLVGKVISTPVGLNVRIKPGHFGALTAQSTGERQKGKVSEYPDAESFRAAMDRGEVKEMPGYDPRRAEHLPNVPLILSDPDVVLRPKNEPHKLVFARGSNQSTDGGRLIFTVYDKRTGELGLLSHHPRDLTDGFLSKHDLVYQRAPESGNLPPDGGGKSTVAQSTGPSPTAPHQVDRNAQVQTAVKPTRVGVRSDQAQDALRGLRQHAPDLARNTRLLPNREALKEADYHPEDWAAFESSEGFYDPRSGEVVVFTDNVTRRQDETPMRAVARVILHERLAHAGLAALRAGDAAARQRWDAFVSDALADPVTGPQIRAIAGERAYAHLADDPAALVEEWAAREVEKMTPAQVAALKPGSLLGRFLRWVREQLAKQFTFLARNTLTHSELKELLGMARQALAKADGGPVLAAVMDPRRNRVSHSAPQQSSPDQEQRAWGQRARQDDRLDPGLRDHLGPPDTYDVAHNEDTMAAAAALIDQHGLAARAVVPELTAAPKRNTHAP